MTAQEEASAYTNLQVLPTDISRAALGEIMLANLQGLGLRRRGGEGCLYCHVGSMDVPRDEWDYASDDKPAKEKARVMMAMVGEINSGFLSRLVDRSDPSVEVGCYTCHAGRTNPMPLPNLLIAEYESGGLDALRRTYRAARARYYEADAYDFRLATLIDVADELVGMEQLEDAAGVHALNLEYYDDPRAHGGLIRLRLVQALESEGSDAMVERYRRLKSEHPPAAFVPLTLDPLAWRLMRSGREEPALRLFELNFAEHPNSFVSTEDLAYAVSMAGDPARGLEIARRWIAANPNHRGGQELLSELLRQGGR